MSFAARDIRRGMDVFSSDGVLLGSVVHIFQRPTRAVATSTQTFEDSTSAGPTFSGESLGPMPTVGLGNRGPAHQQRAARYATGNDDSMPPADSEPAELLVFRTLVALNWGTLWPRLRRYPVSLVLHVAHERIVLAATAAHLDRK